MLNAWYEVPEIPKISSKLPDLLKKLICLEDEMLILELRRAGIKIPSLQPALRFFL